MFKKSFIKKFRTTNSAPSYIISIATNLKQDSIRLLARVPEPSSAWIPSRQSCCRPCPHLSPSAVGEVIFYPQKLILRLLCVKLSSGFQFKPEGIPASFVTAPRPTGPPHLPLQCDLWSPVLPSTLLSCIIYSFQSLYACWAVTWNILLILAWQPLLVGLVLVQMSLSPGI